MFVFAITFVRVYLPMQIPFFKGVVSLQNRTELL